MHDVCWERWLDAMTSDYFVAAYRPELPAEERLRAAASCRELIARLGGGGVRAGRYLVEQLTNADTQRRNAAARALSEVGGIAEVHALTACYLDGDRQWLSPVHLVRAARRHALPESLAGSIGSVPLRVQSGLVRGLLASDTPAGRRLLQRLIQGPDGGLAEAAVEAVSSWGQPQLLWAVLRRADGTDQHPPALLPAAIQAALQLARDEDKRALDWLEERTMDADPILAALAHVALATLGWPGCLVELDDHLRASDGAALAYGIEAAELLAAAALVPALCEVVLRTAEVRGPGLDDNPADHAIRVLERLTGRWVTPELSGYDAHGNLDPATRRRAALLHRSAAASLDPGVRLRLGEPLSFSHLVADLVSPAQRRRRAAAIQLQVSTGSTRGFDPREDLVSNLDAVLAWRAGSRAPVPAGGQFRWRRQAISPPVLCV